MANLTAVWTSIGLLIASVWDLATRKWIHSREQDHTQDYPVDLSLTLARVMLLGLSTLTAALADVFLLRSLIEQTTRETLVAIHGLAFGSILLSLLFRTFSVTRYVRRGKYGEAWRYLWYAGAITALLIFSATVWAMFALQIHHISLPSWLQCTCAVTIAVWELIMTVFVVTELCLDSSEPLSLAEDVRSESMLNWGHIVVGFGGVLRICTLPLFVYWTLQSANDMFTYSQGQVMLVAYAVVSCGLMRNLDQQDGQQSGDELTSLSTDDVAGSSEVYLGGSRAPKPIQPKSSSATIHSTKSNTPWFEEGVELVPVRFV